MLKIPRNKNHGDVGYAEFLLNPFALVLCGE